MSVNFTTAFHNMLTEEQKQTACTKQAPMKANAHVDMKLRNNPEYVTVAEFLAIGDAIKAAHDWQLGPEAESIRVMVLHHASHAKSRTYWLCDYARENTEQTTENA